MHDPTASVAQPSWIIQTYRLPTPARRTGSPPPAREGRLLGLNFQRTHHAGQDGIVLYLRSVFHSICAPARRDARTTRRHFRSFKAARDATEFRPNPTTLAQGGYRPPIITERAGKWGKRKRGKEAGDAGKRVYEKNADRGSSASILSLSPCSLFSVPRSCSVGYRFLISSLF